MTFTFAPATPDDLHALRDLHIDSWRRAYRGMVSDAFLKDGVVAALGRRWQSFPEPHWIVETARENGRLAGFVTVDRHKGPGAYVDNLHVAARAQGRGLGRLLMARAAAILAGEGVARLWLTVIRENAQARAFYRAIGGEEGPGQPDDLFGEPIVSLPVAWSDLPALAALGGDEISAPAAPNDA